ncbi:MAG TPA: hypothetical protein VIC35_03085 [Acidimicrobiia bacterium]|jgi:hypothetical protein
MGDLIFVGVVLVFFGLMAGFVVLCDRVIGPDSSSDLAVDHDEEIATSEEEVAA